MFRNSCSSFFFIVQRQYVRISFSAQAGSQPVRETTPGVNPNALKIRELGAFALETG